MCLLSLQKYYSSPCGPAIKNIEKFILDNIHPWTSTINRSDLANSFSLLPQAGGAGRDGVSHKEAWDKVIHQNFYNLSMQFLRVIRPITGP